MDVKIKFKELVVIYLSVSAFFAFIAWICTLLFGTTDRIWALLFVTLAITAPLTILVWFWVGREDDQIGEG